MSITQVPGFSNVTAGFVDTPLNFNDMLIEHPSATFVMQAGGPRLNSLGIYPRDMLVVDRSKTPVRGSLIICSLDGDLHVKQYRPHQEYIELYPSTGTQPLRVDPEQFEVWGVVTYVIHKA